MWVVLYGHSDIVRQNHFIGRVDNKETSFGLTSISAQVRINFSE